MNRSAARSPVYVDFLIIHLFIDLWGHEFGGAHDAETLLRRCQSQVPDLYLAVVGIEEYIITLEIPACMVPPQGSGGILA